MRTHCVFPFIIYDWNGKISDMLIVLQGTLPLDNNIDAVAVAVAQLNGSIIVQRLPFMHCSDFGFGEIIPAIHPNGHLARNRVFSNNAS